MIPCYPGIQCDIFGGTHTVRRILRETIKSVQNSSISLHRPIPIPGPNVLVIGEDRWAVVSWQRANVLLLLMMLLMVLVLYLLLHLL